MEESMQAAQQHTSHDLGLGFLLVCCFISLAFMQPFSAFAQTPRPFMATPSLVVEDALIPLDLRNLKVGGEIGRRVNITIYNNLLALNIDKDFVLPFRKKEHLGEGYMDYIGLGKNIDAAVRFAAYSGDDKVVAFKNRLVDEIIRTQEPDGYIGIMAKNARMWRLWDIHEMGYVILGLVSDYNFFREKRSLAAAIKLADYIIRLWPDMPAGWEKSGAACIESNFLYLYQATGYIRYLDFCLRQRSLAEWNLDLNIPASGVVMQGHVYTGIDLCLAQLELFHLRPDVRLLRSAGRALDFMTAHDGMTITGAAGLWEMWTNDQGGRGTLGETCATAYQIRLFNRFLQMEGNSQYGDVLERIMYNALFAAQSPDGRRLRYFTPSESDRSYFHIDTYCCPNNFRRIIAELPQMVYYRSAQGVAVNLYASSEAILQLDKGVSLKIVQQTDYPNSGRVTIRLDPAKPATFPILLRIPRWCGEASVSVNEKRYEGKIVSGKFLSIEQQWKAGDQLILDMPMPWRFVLGRNRQAGRVAVMRGPLVFCLNPAQNAALQKVDAADLTNFIIDPGSLKLLPGDSAVHPDGVACEIKIAERALTLGSLRDVSLKLTEFPDPDGKAVYFRVPDYSIGVQDELISGNHR